MSIATVAGLEQRLLAQIAKTSKVHGGDAFALFESLDASQLWANSFQELPRALAGVPFLHLMRNYPTLGCAAACKIGHRFEGVGTVFWARFEAALGTEIPVSERSLLGEAFSRLASRYKLQKPSLEGFDAQFSSAPHRVLKWRFT